MNKFYGLAVLATCFVAIESYNVIASAPDNEIKREPEGTIYYQAGEDKKHQPLWVFKYGQFGSQASDPNTDAYWANYAQRYNEELAYRIAESLIGANRNRSNAELITQFGFIVDASNLSPYAIKRIPFYTKAAQIFYENIASRMAYGYIVHVDELATRVIEELTKNLPDLMSKFTIFKDEEAFAATREKYIEKDQLPASLAGKANHKLVKEFFGPKIDHSKLG